MTINDAGYYESDSVNMNDTKGDIAIDQIVATHTSDGNKRKVTDNSNIYLKQKLLSNRTLPIISATIEPHIDDRVATSGASTTNLTTPNTTKVIIDIAGSNTQALRTP